MAPAVSIRTRGRLETAEEIATAMTFPALGAQGAVVPLQYILNTKGVSVKGVVPWRKAGLHLTFPKHISTETMKVPC